METDGTDEENAPFMDDDDLSFLDEEDEVIEVYDPFEKFNRGMFWFNDKAYFYVMKPVAKGWRWLAPEPLRLGIRNFFSNLRAPIRFVNAALQGKFRDAGNELTRFGVNSTLGIGGLFDPAKAHFGIERKIEDTGQTLAHYGVGPGPYLVLPFLGPSNFRDGMACWATITSAWYRYCLKTVTTGSPFPVILSTSCRSTRTPMKASRKIHWTLTCSCAMPMASIA